MAKVWAWLKVNTWAVYVALGAIASAVLYAMTRSKSSRALEQIEANANWERGAARNEGRAQAWVEQAGEHVAKADEARTQREATTIGALEEVKHIDELDAEQLAALWNEGKIEK